MSSRISDSIGRLFNELEEQDKQGNFDKEDKKRLLADLHSKIVAPENISSDDNENYLSIISIKDIEQLQSQQILERQNQKAEIDKQNEKLENAIRDKEETQKSLEYAAKEILESRNAKIREIYKNDQSVYNQRKNDICGKMYKKKKLQHFFVVIVYILYVAILILLSNIQANIKCWEIISKIACVIIAALPFFRPIINHTQIKDSFAFCLQRAYRDRIRTDQLKKYEEENAAPLLHLYTIEEIMEELIQHPIP